MESDNEVFLMLSNELVQESTRLSESVVNMLPSGTVTVGLSDNGASKDAGCCKTTDGALPGSFRSDPKSVKVGDENGVLTSDGTYLYLAERMDAKGNSEFVMRKHRHTPSLRVPWVFAEPSESDEYGYDIIKHSGKPRVYKKDGRTLTLSMSSSGLGWFRIRPITCTTERTKVLAAMRRLNSTSIPKTQVKRTKRIIITE